jgi:hypothetical protein
MLILKGILKKMPQKTFYFPILDGILKNALKGL